MLCEKCGSIMVPKKIRGSKVLACPYCGKKKKVRSYRLEERVSKKEEIPVGVKTESKATVEVKCPKCGHGKAFYWTLQTRAADEPETHFFKCIKCKHVWREY